jgi:hypothetical protein
MRRANVWLAIFLAIGLLAGPAAVAARGQAEAGAKAAAKVKKAKAPAGKVLGEAEEISGTIKSVDVAESKVTITLAGIPYVFQVTKKTKVEINGQKGDLEALSKAVDQNASIRFVPRSDGNLAEHIAVKSS